MRICEIHIPFIREVVPKIVGAKGVTIKRITIETATSIKLPQNEGEKLEIVGMIRENVESARRQVESAARDLQTHFNIIRITNDTILANYDRFKVISHLIQCYTLYVFCIL